MATFQKTVKKHIFLHPVDKKRKYAAVRATLLQDKKKYSDRLQGALLDVTDLKIVGNRHLVVDGYLSMDVIGDFQVFCPQAGQVLEGVINKKSESHLGCLVMDTFNAALAIPSSCDLDCQVGDLCTFTVSEVVVDGEILFMRGTLVSVDQNPNAPDFGTSSLASTRVDEKTDLNLKENVDIKEESVTDVKVVVKDQPVETDTFVKKKKEKKRKSDEIYPHKKLKSPKKEIT